LKGTRLYLLSIYIISNVFYCYYFSKKGYLGGDFFEFDVPANYESLSVALFLILFSWTLIGTSFFIFEKIKINNLKYDAEKSIDLIFLFFSLFYLFCILKGYVTVVHGEKPNTPSIIKFMLFAFPVLELLPIYLFYRINNFNFTYLLVLFLTFLINILLAKTFVLIVLYVLVNVKLYLYYGKTFIRFNFFSITLGILLYPFLRAFKVFVISFVLISGFEPKLIAVGYFDYIYNGGVELYIDYLLVSLERFQHVANVSYLLDNSFSVSSFFSKFYLLLFDTNIVGLFNKYIFYYNGFSVNTLFASFISKENVTWNAHTGLAGLLFVDITFFLATLLFSVLFIFLSIFLSKSIQSNGPLNELNWTFTVIFLFHGWISAYLSHILALVYFVLLLIFLKSLNLLRGYKCIIS